MIDYRLHFIRHGLTSYNMEGRYLGRRDAPLSEEGKAQLEELREKYSYPYAERVYSSPLLRCVQTALALYPQTELVVMDGLSEYDFGEFEGRTVEELAGDGRYQSWIESSMRTSPPGGETGEGFASRISEALEGIFADMMAQGIEHAAVITHSGVIMTLLSALGLPRGEAGKWYTNSGMGYTILMSPQMWMRDRLFEVSAIVPGLPQEPEQDEE